VRKPAEIDHLEDLGIDRRILLQWIFKWYGVTNLRVP
jgi:hypothetical protein